MRSFQLILSLIALFTATAALRAEVAPIPETTNPASTGPGIESLMALEAASVNVIEQVEPSVVSIARTRPSDLRSPFNEKPNFPFPVPEERRPLLGPENPEFIPNEFGTGIIVGIDPESAPAPRKIYIVTNYHVVRGGPVDGRPIAQDQDNVLLYIRLADRRGDYARIFAADPRSDLAILTLILEDLSTVRPIRFVDPANVPRKGQFVFALGNPYSIARDGSASASWGIISNISRRPWMERPTATEQDAPTIHQLGTLLQVDTRLHLGTSGGALVNLRGELVGITTSLAAIEGYEKSVGYAIPLDGAVQRVIRTLQQGLEVEYGLLGVQLSPDSLLNPNVMLARTGQAGGAQVNVLDNSPAEQGGLRANDVVLAVNDRRVYSQSDLTREVGKQPPGDKVKLSVFRSVINQTLDLEVQLGKWPVRDEEGIIATRRRHEPWRGLVVDYPTARQKYEVLLQGAYPRGVVVLESAPGSIAARAEIEPGQLIAQVGDRPVTTPNEFYAAVSELTGEVTLVLQLSSGGLAPPTQRRVKVPAR